MNTKILILILISLSLASCSSNIRFASSAKYIKDYKIDNLPESKQQKSLTSRKSIERKDNAIENGYGTWLDGELTDWQTKLVAETDNWLGVPYQYGGTDLSGVDCSAFVQNVYASLGISLPRTAAMQYDSTMKIEYDNRQMGDLIFFKKKDNISHVGIYLGNDMVVHASTSRGVVHEDLFCTFFTNTFAGFGRIRSNKNNFNLLSGR